MAVLFYNGAQERATAFFAPLLALDPVVNRTGMMPYWQLAWQANVRFDRRRSRKSGGGIKLRFPPDKDLIPVLWRDFDQVMQEFPQMGDSVLAIELLPFSKLLSVPVEATACAHRVRLYNVGLLLFWYNPPSTSSSIDTDRLPGQDPELARLGPGCRGRSGCVSQLCRA
ncbi:hypothetical protein BDV11DRAFT_195379 [Aspergillus similis]